LLSITILWRNPLALIVFTKKVANLPLNLENFATQPTNAA